MSDTRTPEMIVCCRVDDPDPACIVQEGHSLATCSRCGYDVRISPGSVKVMLEYGAQPVCIQCVAELPKDAIVLVRRWPL